MTESKGTPEETTKPPRPPRKRRGQLEMLRDEAALAAVKLLDARTVTSLGFKGLLIVLGVIFAGAASGGSAAMFALGPTYNLLHSIHEDKLKKIDEDIDAAKENATEALNRATSNKASVDKTTKEVADIINRLIAAKPDITPEALARLKALNKLSDQLATDHNVVTALEKSQERISELESQVEIHKADIKAFYAQFDELDLKALALIRQIPNKGHITLSGRRLIANSLQLIDRLREDDPWSTLTLRAVGGTNHESAKDKLGNGHHTYGVLTIERDGNYRPLLMEAAGKISPK